MIDLITKMTTSKTKFCQITGTVCDLLGSPKDSLSQWVCFCCGMFEFAYFDLNLLQSGKHSGSLPIS